MIDVTKNDEAVPGNVYMENVELSGVLEIGPAWSGHADEEDFAPMPKTLGPALVTTIQNLNMKDGMLSLDIYSPAAQANRLDIDTLSGQGEFYITTQLADGKGWGDSINIRKHATGNFGTNVQDSGKEPTKITSLDVVHVNSGDAAFRLTNKDQTVEVGTWQYSLKKKQDSEKTDWYLQGKRKGDKDTDNGNGDNGTTAPVLSYSAKGVMAMAAAPRQVLQAESVSLQQRLGNYYSNPQDYGRATCTMTPA